MERNVSPGYCIVQQSGTLNFQVSLLFNNTDSDAARYFMALNADTQWLKAGQILIIADPLSYNPPYALQAMNQAKQQVNRAMADMDHNEANFLQKNHGAIDALTSYGGGLVGFAADAGEKYFVEINRQMKQIELLYQRQYMLHGKLNTQAFLQERRMLLLSLNGILTKLSKVSLAIPEHSNLKRTLQLSSKSIVHEWNTAGVGAIKGYSSTIERSAKIVKWMKVGGWVAIGIGGLNTTNTVYDACTTGRESECSKVAVKEYTKFGLSTGLAIRGGLLGASIMGGVCVAAGIATAGAGGIACVIVGSAAGGWLGGEIGNKLGDVLVN
ncbi:Uncharacterised protein [Yersinia thracica]|uniref:Uncharacterized protein n=1 Tax=Yersinia thracica TaxID=2890319 RepID=A0A0T9QE04_9GAMM|nr:hypothetical protein [Yersinia thracica]CNI07523.1 Uncharacterised protein [Yersinia thracica]